MKQSFKSHFNMRMMHSCFSRKNTSFLLLTMLTIALLISCRKNKDQEAKPVISYKQKTISLNVDMPMTAIKPDSTGGSITGYSVSPILPKGISIDRLNGTISGKPSDTLLPTKYVVSASGPGGIGTDTITLSVGTVAFNYGAT